MNANPLMINSWNWKRRIARGIVIAMRCMFPVFLLANILGFPAAAQSTMKSKRSALDEAEKTQVLKVEAQVNEALVAGDADVLSHIYADDLSYTNQIGEVLTKSEVLANLKTGNIKLPTLGRQDIRLHAFDGTVVLTGISTSILRYKGVVTNKPRRFANVYVKQNGQWMLVAHTVTEITK